MKKNKINPKILDFGLELSELCKKHKVWIQESMIEMKDIKGNYDIVCFGQWPVNQGELQIYKNDLIKVYEK